VVKVTRLVVEALKADSIPLARVHEFDGFFDSGWIDAKTLEPTRRRPLGPEVVRVRGWVDPSKPGFNEVSLETVYVPLADPSRPARELEIPAPADHPVAKRIADLMKQLVEKYGDPAAREQVKKAPGGPPIPGAQPARDTSKAGRRPPASDTTASPAPAVKRDTTVKRDTVDLT
jgi:hypothetical protein